MVDESFARRFWPGQDPIGKRISFADHPKDDSDWMTVIGVAASIRQENPASRYMTVYQPVAQVQVPFFLQEVSLVVRSKENPASLAPALRAQVWNVDKDLPIRSMSSMQDLLYTSTAEPRFQTRVLASFSSIAFLLAIIGIYGVMAYSVTQRTQEIGIRMAIGAQRGHIVQMILWRSAALVAGGLAIGLAGAWAATRVLKDFLFEVTPFDPADVCGRLALAGAGGAGRLLHSRAARGRHRPAGGLAIRIVLSIPPAARWLDRPLSPAGQASSKLPARPQSRPL